MELFSDPVLLFSLLLKLNYRQIKKCRVNNASNGEITKILNDNYFWQQKAAQDYNLQSHVNRNWKSLYECAYELTGQQVDKLLYNCIVYKKKELAEIMILEGDQNLSLKHVDWCIEFKTKDVLTLVLDQIQLSEEMLHYYLLKYPCIEVDLLKPLIKNIELVDDYCLRDAILSYKKAHNKPAQRYLLNCINANQIL